LSRQTTPPTPTRATETKSMSRYPSQVSLLSYPATRECDTVSRSLVKMFIRDSSYKKPDPYTRHRHRASHVRSRGHILPYQTLPRPDHSVLAVPLPTQSCARSCEKSLLRPTTGFNTTPAGARSCKRRRYDLAAADRGCAAMAVSDLACAVQGGTAVAAGDI
jgi:hypothetical protein